jgi:toxin YoeB
VSWRVLFTREAQKDARKLACAAPADDLFRQPPPFETLVGDLRGAYSRRINIQHRLVYSVDSEGGVVRVLRMWSHYD